MMCTRCNIIAQFRKIIILRWHLRVCANCAFCRILHCLPCESMFANLWRGFRSQRKGRKSSAAQGPRFDSPHISSTFSYRVSCCFTTLSQRFSYLLSCIFLLQKSLIFCSQSYLQPNIKNLTLFQNARKSSVKKWVKKH